MAKRKPRTRIELVAEDLQTTSLRAKYGVKLGAAKVTNERAVIAELETAREKLRLIIEDLWTGNYGDGHAN